MSTILEELDTMYEVKGDATLAARYRITDDRYRSKSGLKKSSNSNDHDPYRPDDAGEMRNSFDYNNRRAWQFADKRASDMHDNIKSNKKKQFDRMVKSYNKHNECTETIDTLDMIL